MSAHPFTARARDLYTSLLTLPASREKSIALTKLEECVMWADKAPTEAPAPPPLPPSSRPR